MKKKKSNLISILTMGSALAALLLSLLGLGTVPEDQSHLINDLYAENQALEERVSALENQLNQLLTAESLESWSLDVSPWADSTGADVTLTATPTGYRTGISGTLLILLEGREVTSVPCSWDGSAFTATASLSAADGYSYYFLLTLPEGTRQLPLVTPDSPEAGASVYLQSALGAYCNLIVNDWIENPGSMLVLTDAYAQVQLPWISADDALDIATSEIVLRLNGEESIRIPIKLAPSEVTGSYDLSIRELQIPMPELDSTDVMELSLEVSLTDGRRLTAFGITWHQEKGKLTSAVG